MDDHPSLNVGQVNHPISQTAIRPERLVGTGKETDSERILAVQSAKSAFVWQTTCKTRRWAQPSARTKFLTGHPEVRPCSYEAILHVPLSDILQHGTLCAEDVPIGVLQDVAQADTEKVWKNNEESSY